MYNLACLNSYEFELLCKDIFEVKLNTTLHCFASGRDGGIDICDSGIMPKVIIQCKHYPHSKYSDLLSKLKKETVTINKKKPSEYYICTSLELTKKNKDEVYALFADYMSDNSNIIDQIEINTFLELDINQDIVKRHFKLWLSGSNILSMVLDRNIFLDCEELLYDIRDSANLFVETQAYHDALKIIKNEGVILITGGPGVGKSTLSKMLILYFAFHKYSVRYSTDNEIGNIKRVLSQDPEKKEIILLDDFLGQHYLNIKNTIPAEIKTLLSVVKRNPNKKLILNSRVTILHEAQQKFISFNQLIENHDTNVYLINLDNMSNLEKAKILYNHIYFNSLPEAYFFCIKSNRNFLTIVKHTNYNPRIIEFVTKNRNYLTVSPDGYLQYILNILADPEKVWRDEFQNRISSEDRILVETLYSLTNTSIDVEILDRAFTERIRCTTLDKSNNIFRITLTRLNGSLIKSIDENGIHRFSVANPSINDYLRTEIGSNVSEQIEVIKNALFIEQILKVAVSEAANITAEDILVAGKFLKMKVLKNSSFYYYIGFIVKNKTYNSSLIRDTNLAFEHIYENLSAFEKDNYCELVFQFINDGFSNFYNCVEVLLDPDKLRPILMPMYVDSINDLFELLITREILNETDYHQISSFESMLKELLIEKILDDVVDDFEDKLLKIVSDVIYNNPDTTSDYMNDISSCLEDDIWDRASDKIYDEISYKTDKLHELIAISTDDFDISDAKYRIYIDNAIHSCLAEEENDRDDDSYQRIYGNSEDTEIALIFER